MKKVRYISNDKNEVCIYLDKTIFKNEESEIDSIVKIVKLFHPYKFSGTFISDCDIDINKLKNISLKIELISYKKSLFYNNFTIDITFELFKIIEILRLFYKMDITFEGYAVRSDESKFRIVINDHDGSCIIVNKELINLDNCKKEIEKIIKEQN